MPCIPEEPRLEAMFAAASRVRVFDGGAFGERPPMGRAVLDLERDDIGELREAIVLLGAGSASTCRCRGDAALVFERDGEALGRIIVHHGDTIRFQDGVEDDWFDTGSWVLSFLAGRGFPAPLDRYERVEALKAATSEPRRSWIECAPPALRLRLDELERGELSPAAALALVEPEYASIDEVAAALLEWIVVHHEPWVPLAAFEHAAMDLLNALPLEALERAALEAPGFGDSPKGAARYFSTVGTTRVAQLSAPARARIRQAGQTPGLPAINRELVTRAFGPPEAGQSG